MASTIVTKRRVVGNPAKRQTNGILGLSWNPAKTKGVAAMAKTKAKSKKPGTKHRAPGGKAVVKHNASKPVMMMVHKKKPTIHKKNTGGSKGVANALLGAVVVVASAVASKVGAQMVLGAKNTGVMGYAGNVLAGGALYFAAKSVTRNEMVLNSIMSGTAVQVVLRGINDYTPLGEFVKDLGMGDYQVQSYVTPQILKAPHESAAIRVPDGWGRGEVVMMPAASAVAPASGMGALYGGKGGGLY